MEFSCVQYQYKRIGKYLETIFIHTHNSVTTLDNINNHFGPLKIRDWSNLFLDDRDYSSGP